MLALEKRTEGLTSAEARSAAAVASLLLDVVPIAMKALRQELRTSRCEDLTIPQFRILAHLWCEPANNKTLAEALGVSVPATSRMVKFLAQRKLIERTKDHADKREVRLKLSGLGLAHFEHARETVRKNLTRRMSAVNPAKLRKSETGLLAIKAILADLSLR